jgi:hypothetical protein
VLNASSLFQPIHANKAETAPPPRASQFAQQQQQRALYKQFTQQLVSLSVIYYYSLSCLLAVA